MVQRVWCSWQYVLLVLVGWGRKWHLPGRLDVGFKPGQRWVLLVLLEGAMVMAGERRVG